LKVALDIHKLNLIIIHLID